MNALQEDIVQLAREKNALILAHFYQTMDIQDIAHVVGDSFEMARRAQVSEQDLIVVCGVRFMAESAKLLNAQKTVLLPAPDAGCPMADMVTPEDVTALRKKHPHATFMCYVNSSAAVKAQCDICCTSSSAVRIAQNLPGDEIVFLPDQNLGQYVARQVPDKRFIFFSGFCPVHHAVLPIHVQAARQAHPEAKVIVHPECRPDVVDIADFVGSTSELLNYVERDTAKSFIIGTEIGVVERLQHRVPDKEVFLLKSGFVCPNMKKTTLQDIYDALQTEHEAIEIDPNVADGARTTLERMVRCRL